MGGEASDSDSSDSDSDSGIRLQKRTAEVYPKELSVEDNIPSPEKVPISDNTSPMIRKLEVPKIEKADDHHHLKGISQL
jgi:hypothetical protein